MAADRSVRDSPSLAFIRVDSSDSQATAWPRRASQRAALLAPAGWRRNNSMLCSVPPSMKTKQLFLAALLAAIPALGRAAAPPPKTVDPRMQVNFFEPEKYTDVKMTMMGDDRDRDDL